MSTLTVQDPMQNNSFSFCCIVYQTEAPLMIRPFFEKLTVSEIHAVCTGGFATIAGSVMAAYIIYGVNIVISLSDILSSC